MYTGIDHVLLTQYPVRGKGEGEGGRGREGEGGMRGREGEGGREGRVYTQLDDVVCIFVVQGYPVRPLWTSGIHVHEEACAGH